LNALLREILADELERLDDDRLELLTITSVDIEGDLRRAAVFYDSLQGEDGDEEVLAALAELRGRLQGAIARQARIKRTPELVFAPDPAVRAGARIEALLAEIPDRGGDGVDAASDGAASADGAGATASDGDRDEAGER
jgi:ribosome-binding factor A